MRKGTGYEHCKELDRLLEQQGKAVDNMGFEAGTDMDSGLGVTAGKDIPADNEAEHLVVRTGDSALCAMGRPCVLP